MTVEPFALERFFAEHEFTTPHLLSVSDCETSTVADLLALEDGARQRLERLALGYTESDGSPELRAAVAAREDGLTADDVVVHAAGVEVLLTVALAVLEPGDHAVVQSPCYQAARSGPELAGASVTPWRARRENGWAPDLDELPRLLRPGTRLLVVNTPHNPTGHHFSREALDRLVALAEERGILLLVDEAYRGAEYRDGDRLPCAATLSPAVASLGLLSKAWGLPGLRTAWLVSRNPKIREAVSRAKDYTTICAPAPAEFLATLALRSGDSILRRNREILRTNLGLLEGLMARHAGRLGWVRPRAGSVCMPWLREGEAQFCRAAREQAGVLLAPGPLFDGDPAAFRVGFGRRSFGQGLEALDRWLGGAV